MKLSSIPIGLTLDVPMPIPGDDIPPGPAEQGATPVENITVFIPVTCPRCGLAGLMESPVIVVRTALTLWNNMRLYADCHAVAWNATRGELNDIRSYLAGRGRSF